MEKKKSETSCKTPLISDHLCELWSVEIGHIIKMWLKPMLEEYRDLSS